MTPVGLEPKTFGTERQTLRHTGPVVSPLGESMARRFIPNGVEGGKGISWTIWQWPGNYICVKGWAEQVPRIGKSSILLSKLRHAIFKQGTVQKERLPNTSLIIRQRDSS
ncbi:hypothetical protein CDAR_212131 [Caerostris darwini]|uniref:Uncharacterized protein n=1 Tax=Caerostris darwini TaxID=1538125 RepID=A0AAV4NSA9_9ARAC|nr:hypothetical protein CDAR_212131 [Caerostris darwini]